MAGRREGDGHKARVPWPDVIPARVRAGEGGTIRTRQQGQVEERALGDPALHRVLAGEGSLLEPLPGLGGCSRRAGVIGGYRHRLRGAGGHVAQLAAGKTQHVARGKVGGTEGLAGGDRQRGAGGGVTPGIGSAPCWESVWISVFVVSLKR